MAEDVALGGAASADQAGRAKPKGGRPEPNGAPDGASRNAGIDAFRFLACFGVIAIHTIQPRTLADSAVFAVSQAAVPFYFITAGYFLRDRDTAIQLVTRPALRLGPVYLFWLAFYQAFAFATWSNFPPWSLRTFIAGGAGYHLWFLPALFLAMLVVGLGRRFLGFWPVALLCLSLGVVSLANGAYHDVLGLSGEPRRGGLLIAPLLCLIGNGIAHMQAKPGLLLAMLLLFAGLAGSFAELWVIGPDLWGGYYAVSTLILATGLFLVARALPWGPVVSRLAPLGRYVLGIYVVHVLVIMLTVHRAAPQSALDYAGLIVAILLVSTLLAWALSKVPLVKRLVI